MRKIFVYIVSGNNSLHFKRKIRSLLLLCRSLPLILPPPPPFPSFPYNAAPVQCQPLLSPSLHAFPLSFLSFVASFLFPFIACVAFPSFLMPLFLSPQALLHSLTSLLPFPLRFSPSGRSFLPCLISYPFPAFSLTSLPCRPSSPASSARSSPSRHEVPCSPGLSVFFDYSSYRDTLYLFFHASSSTPTTPSYSSSRLPPSSPPSPSSLLPPSRAPPQRRKLGWCSEAEL